MVVFRECWFALSVRVPVGICVGISGFPSVAKSSHFPGGLLIRSGRGIFPVITGIVFRVGVGFRCPMGVVQCVVVRFRGGFIRTGLFSGI